MTSLAALEATDDPPRISSGIPAAAGASEYQITVETELQVIGPTQPTLQTASSSRPQRTGKAVAQTEDGYLSTSLPVRMAASLSGPHTHGPLSRRQLQAIATAPPPPPSTPAPPPSSSAQSQSPPPRSSRPSTPSPPAAKRLKLARSVSLGSRCTSASSPPPDRHSQGKNRGTLGSKRYTLYDAIASRVHTQAPPPRSERSTLYSTRTTILSADQVLFRRKNAPARFAERDVYWQNIHSDLPPSLLPQSDLLKCLHAFVSDFGLGQVLLREKRLRGGKPPELDNADGAARGRRAFTFWDQLNEVLFGVVPPVSPPPRADPEYLRWHAERKGKAERRRRYRMRKEELEELMQEVEELGPMPEGPGEEERGAWEEERERLLARRGLGREDLQDVAGDVDGKGGRAREVPGRAKKARVGSEDEEGSEGKALGGRSRGGGQRRRRQGKESRKKGVGSSITRLNTLMNRGNEPAAAGRGVASCASGASKKRAPSPRPGRARSTSTGAKARRARHLVSSAVQAEKSFDGTALLALGILAEELCREALGAGGWRVLTEGLVPGRDGDGAHGGGGGEEGRAGRDDGAGGGGDGYEGQENLDSNNNNNNNNTNNKGGEIVGKGQKKLLGDRYVAYGHSYELGGGGEEDDVGNFWRKKGPKAGFRDRDVLLILPPLTEGVQEQGGVRVDRKLVAKGHDEDDDGDDDGMEELEGAEDEDAWDGLAGGRGAWGSTGAGDGWESA
ncbi:hypothetical protein MKZ38_001430 [Zalerion maritima]|uniref:Uncharacterized protein n=1 Tax=Zalerion maritima TaxID=339359 RepID=A0AAD5RQ74_9PEZI|nr:hypothetical protein MKZ38_001430 [Zalerion maritima]